MPLWLCIWITLAMAVLMGMVIYFAYRYGVVSDHLTQACQVLRHHSLTSKGC